MLAVCGPAVIHTGGGPEVARLVRAGWIQVLFAGNGFATHDIESNVMGTSLGISVTEVSAISTTRPRAKITCMPMGRLPAGGSSTWRTPASASA